MDDYEEDMEELDLNPEDLEMIAVLYDSIRAVRRKVEKNHDKALAEDFDHHLKSVMYDLSMSLKNDVPTPVKNANILKAKMSLYDICFIKANEYLKKSNEVIGNIYERIHEGHAQLFKEFLRIECPL